MCFALFHFRCDVEGERNPQLRGLRQCHTSCQHTNNVEGLTVQDDLLVNDLRIAAKTFLPQRVTEDRDLVVTSLFVVECECAAENRDDLECLKVISGDRRCLETFRIAAARQCYRNRHHVSRCKLFERLVLISIVEKV